MAPLCKKHNKPRSVIYERRMPRGGTFQLVGCEDCAAAAAKSARVKLKPKKESKQAPSGTKFRRI